MLNKSTFLYSAVWSFFQQFGFTAINFIVSIILARLLLPNDFGTYGIALIFSGIANLISDSGISSSLIRTKEIDDLDYNVAFWSNVGISFVLYFVVFFASPYIALFYSNQSLTSILRIVSLSIIISSLTTVQSVRLTKELKFKKKFLVGIPALLTSGFIGIYLASNNYGIWSLVYKDLTFYIVAGFNLWLSTKWYPSFIFDRSKLNHHFSFGYKLLITDLISRFFQDSYKLIIGKSFSFSELGFFTRAKSMEELPSQVVFNTINRVLFPMLAQVQDDEQRLKKVYSQIIKMVTFLVTPLLMLLHIVAEPLFVFLLTEKWLPAVPYFKILIIAGMIAPLQPYLLNICKVKGRSDLVLKLSIVEYIFIALSMLAMIPWGMNGLLWGLVVATLAKLLVAMFFAGSLIEYSIKEQLFDLKEGFILSLIGFLFIKVLDKSNILPLLDPLYSLVIIASLYYIFLFFISWLFRFESITLIKILIKRN